MIRNYAVISLLLTASLLGSAAQAQSFFYVEEKGGMERIVVDKLNKASQYVIKSPLSSDFIIKTDVAYQEGSKKFTISMQIIDSLSLVPVLRAEEIYPQGSLDAHSMRSVYMALQSLMERNMDQIMLVSKRCNTLMPLNTNHLKKDHV